MVKPPYPLYYIADEILTAWLADLRANPHLQGKGSLCYDGLYCCWGRAADLAVQRDHGSWVQSEEHTYFRGAGGQLENELMNLHAETWLGLKGHPLNPYEYRVRLADDTHLTQDVKVPYQSNAQCLANLNDGWSTQEPLPFAEIADLIEKHFRPLSEYPEPLEELHLATQALLADVQALPVGPGCIDRNKLSVLMDAVRDSGDRLQLLLERAGAD